jgi:hypothetical protein
MNNLTCPVCNGKVVSRCPCLKGSSMCENKHSFHFSIKLIKLNVSEVEVHEGLGDHFSDSCEGCVVISKYVEKA